MFVELCAKWVSPDGEDEETWVMEELRRQGLLEVVEHQPTVLPVRISCCASKLGSSLLFFSKYGAESPALRRMRAKQRGTYRIFGAYPMKA